MIWDMKPATWTFVFQPEPAIIYSKRPQSLYEDIRDLKCWEQIYPTNPAPSWEW